MVVDISQYWVLHVTHVLAAPHDLDRRKIMVYYVSTSTMMVH